MSAGRAMRGATPLCAGLLLGCVWALARASSPADVPAPDAGGTATTPPPNLPRWIDFSNLPFIPVPEIAADPNGGTTVGFLPVWLTTDDNHAIRQIYAPDILYNPYFGVGFHGRAYSYKSEDEQASLIVGAMQRVEREVDAEYQLGRLRQTNWSVIGDLIYERDGTPRFFGIGNSTPESDQTNYTLQQELTQGQIGFNLTPSWQVLYTGRIREVDVTSGTLAHIASIQTRFPGVDGLGYHYEQLNRLSIIYDSRDNIVVPRSGMEWVVYGGAASRTGIFNDSMYTEAGIDGRDFHPLGRGTVLATHVSLHYLPTASDLPFWALSSIGGGDSVIGGDQLLRGYGAGRFYDRNSFSATAELRHTYWSFTAMSTNVDLEVAPFVDVGDVFHRVGQFPIDQLHKVAGVGFRGIARPSVVGFVDVGYGDEGAAVFTGLNYPF